MSSKVANHIHRYKKINLARNGNDYFVYKCTKPTCTHYVPIDLAEGKMCECNRCGEPMLISRAILIHSSGKPMTKPHCSDCVVRKNKKDVDAIAAFLSGNKT